MVFALSLPFMLLRKKISREIAFLPSRQYPFPENPFF